MPTFPSTIAVMVVLPTETPRTTPAEETVATVVSVLAHTKFRCADVSVAPVALRSTDVIATSRPTRAGDGNDNVTVFTGTNETVTVIVDVLPPTEVVMIDVPAETAVTNPDGETVATAGVPDVQVVTNDVKTLFAASRAVAVAWKVCPTKNVDVGAPVMVTVATVGSITNTVTVACTSPDVARIDACPRVTPVMTPAAETVATAGVKELQVTGEVRGRPIWSDTVAVSVTVRPTSTCPAAGEIATCVATGVGEGSVEVSHATTLNNNVANISFFIEYS